MSKRRLSFLVYTLTFFVLASVPLVYAVSKVSKYAYAVQNDQLVVYTVNPDGGLRVIQAITTGQAAPAIGTDTPFVSPSNKFVYTLTGVNGSQSIWGYKIGSNGTLTQIAGSPFAATGAVWMAFTPNDKFAYVVSWTPDSESYSEYVEEFSVNTSTGVLTSIGTIFTGPDACDVVVNSKGTLAYVANCAGTTISAFSINLTSGALTPVSGSPFSVPGAGVPVDVLLSPNGKYLFSVNFANGNGGESISVFTRNATTGALTAQSNYIPASDWVFDGGGATLDPTGKFIYVGSNVSGVGVEAFSVDETNGTIAPIDRYPAGTLAYGETVDASTGFLYSTNLGGTTANEPPLFVFAITPGTGALTQVATYGLDGQSGSSQLSFVAETARAVYTPTFAYVTNSGSKSITELKIASGELTPVTGSPLTDTNGPQASVAAPNGKFFYTGNTNGSISEYDIEATGVLKKITGSPIKGLTNPVGLAISSFYDALYVEDPTAEDTFDYTINTKTGALSLFSSGATDGNGPEAIAVDPFGAFTLVVNNTSDQVAVGIPGTGFVNTVATGSGPVAITIDPSSQFVYVANSGDGTVSGYNLTLASPYMTPISGSPYGAGTKPSALVAEPYGRYLYVANAGSDSISAYSIDPLTGVLSPISGTFSTSGSPSAMSVSIDGKYLYATDKDVSELDEFSINSDGTLTSAGGAGLGTAPTSITTIGTYK
jgi:6-phosphogluconolactonase